MSSSVIKNGKITIPRSVYIKSLVFLGLIILTVVIMQPIQTAVTEGIQKIRTGLIEKIEELTNLEIRYSSLRPSIFGSFDIRDLQFIKDNKPLLSVSRIRMHFSLFDLLLKKKTFIHSVTFDSPVFNIDAEKDKETVEYLISLIRTDDTFSEIMQQISGFLPDNVEYLIRHCNINIIDNKTVYQVKDMNLNMWGNDENIFLAGRFNAEIFISDLLNKTVIFNTDIGIDISASDNLRRGNIDIILYNFLCSAMDSAEDMKSVKAMPMFTVHPANFTINYIDNLISSNSKNDDQNFKYTFQFNAENGDLLAGINLNDFLLGDKINITDNWKNAMHLLKVNLTGEAFYKKENEKMNYMVNLTNLNIDNKSDDSLLIDIIGDEKLLTVNDVSLVLSPQTAKAGLFQGGVNVTGAVQFEPLKPSGRIILDRFSLTGGNNGRDAITTVLDINSRNDEIRITSPRVAAAQSLLNDLNIILYLSPKDTALSFSTSFANNGEVLLDAVFNGNPRELEASMILKTVSFYDISEIFRPFVDYARFPAYKNILDDYLVSTEVFFSTDFENVVFNAPNVVFDLNGSPGMLSITATDSLFSIREGVFYLNEEELLVSANVLYSNPMELIFSINASYLDLSWNMDGQLYDKTTLILSDPNGLNLYGSLSNNNAVSGYIEGIDFPVYINNETVYLNFFMNLRYNSMDLWDLSVDHITARAQDSPSENEFFRISGIANQNGASLRDILYKDSVGILAGSADFTWEEDFSFLSFLINFSDGHESGELYNLEGFLQDEHVGINASVTNMRLNRFVRNSAPMLISADADIAWDSIDSFNANININKLNSVMPNDYIRGSVEININNEELLINNLIMDIAGLRAVLPELQINRSDGKASAMARMKGLALERNVEGNLYLNINFAKLNSWLEISNALNHFNGTVNIDNIMYNNAEQEPFTFVFSRNNSAISISGGIRDMLRLDLDDAGNFYAGLSAPSPIRGSFIGTYKQGIIDARCNNFYFDLAFLWSLISRVPEFNIAAGYLTGAIDIRGPIWNPEFYGSARASSFNFQVPNFVREDIRAVPFNILIEGYEMTFGPVVSSIGTGSGIINGWFLFENWRPVNIGLDISIPRELPVPYGLNIVGFLAKGTASGNLNLNIDSINALAEYKGDLFTNNAELGLNMEELGKPVEIDVNNIRMFTLLDFKITLGSTVEFVWPSTSPILRGNPEMGTVVTVSSDNRAGQFSMVSDVKIRSGEVYYFDRSFYIRQGTLVFRENENQFDPRFTARAEIRDRTDSGPVTISMIVENQPLLSFEPRFEASPTMSQLEIYSILGQNVNRIQGGENPEAAQRFLITSTTDILTQVVATTDVFSQFDFMRQFERTIRGVFKLDMFSIRTRLLQNAIVTGASGFQQDNDIIGRSSRVGNYFDNTTVFIGKYIGQHMFVQFMGTMRYDENSDFFGGLKFELDIGIELQSPFVNIRWDFFPYHPQNWWVNDNSITLSWSKSF